MSRYDLTAPAEHIIIEILREEESSAARTAEAWGISQSPRSEQYADRDRRVVNRLRQLIRAVEAGLFDQLDAALNMTDDGVLADWERELLANSVDPTPEQQTAAVAELAAVEEFAAQHDPRTCTECADQYEAEQAADWEAEGEL